ncbi:MAG: UDP-glucose 4-epimerase GalE [Candidatus Sedimenticola sp. (ex Thyasira tokunagai)]
MRILCTGGAGYVGSACLRYLLKKGYEAFAYDNLSEGRREAVPDADARLIVGDLSDYSSLVKCLRDYEIDAVMHFAAVASVPESISQPALYWDVNVTGTKNLLDAMFECGIKNIVFSSTAATYAFSDKMPLVEEDLQKPVTPYGTTKLACESMLNDYRIAYDIGFTAMRYFNASGADPDGEYGEDRNDESHLIPLVLYAAVGRRKEVKVFGTELDTRDGSCIRDYVHVEDIARAHVLAMESHKPGIGRFFNIGSNTGATVKEIITACESVAGKPITWQPAEQRPGDPSILVASADKLINELGWSPKYKTVSDIVETAHRWHSKYPNGYADK